MPLPALFMVFDVPGLALLVMRHRIDAALDDPQPCAVGLLDQAELDERRVVLIRSCTLRVVPAEGEATEWFGVNDSNRHDRVKFFVSAAAASRHPCERAVCAGAGIDLRRIAEPAADLLGLGYHAPDDLRARLDQDLSFDTVSGHSGSSSYRCATDGCGMCFRKHSNQRLRVEQQPARCVNAIVRLRERS